MDTQTTQACSQYFKALSDETRIKMIGLLLDRELCVCDLMEVLDLPQSTASRHLSYLKNSELIKGRREGKWMYYKLVEDRQQFQHLQSIFDYISELSDLLKLRQKLETYLKQKAEDGHCSV